jgi:hypothetical protein
MGEQRYSADAGTHPMPDPRPFGEVDRASHTPDIALWKPTLTDLLLAGLVAGAILGAANGAVAHLIVSRFESAWEGCLIGTGLGIVGGILVVLWRRIVWGPDISVEVGTAIGLLFGIVPGVALVFVRQLVVVSWGFVGLLMAGSMMGALIGGVLDRITEAVVARMKRKHAERIATANRD